MSCTGMKIPAFTACVWIRIYEGKILIKQKAPSTKE